MVPLWKQHFCLLLHKQRCTQRARGLHPRALLCNIRYRWTNVRSCLPHVLIPPHPGLGLHIPLQGTLGPALDKLLELGQVLPGVLTYAFQPWSGQLGSHLYLGREWHSQWSYQDQLNLGFTVCSSLSGVPSWDFFSNGSWWDFNLWTPAPHLSASTTRPHGQLPATVDIETRDIPMWTCL